ncbi:TPA: 30S ribosomal protein S24e [archaeon]|uniref:Small ribosomal subunit protein eS24 n=1 Tax=Candidatus Naiadarchaeum limnaeum TaxID=2756139 RepID=A0A832XGS4_9ARCH|nr:30S ribosomal protein S24e [Candidatus Naiadarchaeum limnaeum]
MEVKITKQIENKLLNRKELRVLIDNNGATPKSDDIAGKVAALLNVDKNLIVIETTHQYFGVRRAEAYIKVYNTLEDLQKTEPKSKEKKEKAPAAEKKEEAKAT